MGTASRVERTEATATERPPLVGKGMTVLFVVLIACFTAWGVAADLTTPMVAGFKRIFEMSTFQASLVQLAYFGAYFLLAIPAAYALARLTIPGKRGVLGVLLCVSMFPQMAIAGPIWRLLDSLGGLNHRWGVVLPYVALTLPLAIWILASFFKELPPELEDAARVDGCGPWGTLFHITLPLATPGIFTAAILILIYAWNEFFFALLILTQPEQQTLPVGIALFQGEFTMPWGELAAASVVATLPLIVVVLLCQRWIVSGLSAGAVKG